MKRTIAQKMQALSAAFGAGQLKQAQIAGSYPPPPVDVPEDPAHRTDPTLFPGAGTVSGRFNAHRPPMHEIPRTFGEDPVGIHPLADADYSRIEARLNAEPLPPLKLSDMLTQAKISHDRMEEWAAVMRAQGYVQGEGAAWDEWTKDG